MRIDGKVVIITGASEGIGAACAAEFARAGAKLSLTARREEQLRSVGGAEALVTAGDLASDAIRRAVVERTLDRFGTVDILINNAGIGFYAPSWQSPEALTRQMFELNFFALLAMTQLVVPHMRARQSGMVVNVSSIAAKVPLPWMTLYSASKSAVNSFTEGLRMELRRDNVKAMLVCPGYVTTAFQQHVTAGKAPDRVVRARRFAITPQQCASAIRRGVERDARTVLSPAGGWLLVAAARLLPGVVAARMAAMNETP